MRRIGHAVGASEQTVARRYRRLRGSGVLRVVGLLDPRQLGQTLWTVRLQCRPDSTRRLAEVLARRDDVGWVSMSGGGSEITCVIRSTNREQREDLLLSRLPNTSQVLSLTTHATLHQFRGGRDDDWLDANDLLDEAQRERLDPPPLPAPGAPVRIEPAEQPMLDVLGRDGRAGLGTLAAAVGWSENRVARRLETLQAAQALYFDVDVASEAVGFGTSATLWITVEPARLAAAGAAVAAFREVPFAAAITGTANLQASVICRDMEELYVFVTTGIGAVTGIRQVEISPVLRRIKQAGALMDGLRLAVPSPTPRTRR